MPTQYSLKGGLREKSKFHTKGDCFVHFNSSEKESQHEDYTVNRISFPITWSASEKDFAL